jgi:uncharacterized repeat protein (TIGR03803 family)
LVAVIVLMSVVVLSGEELKHVPPAAPTFVLLHSFTGADGLTPVAGLIRDAGGNLYGTTRNGGASGNGVVFKLSPTGTETVLHNFAGYPTDGEIPLAELVRDVAGNLYGTTDSGGASGFGVVFKLSPNGTETVLHNFAGYPTDGASPGGLVQDAAGNLYGTTREGGTGCKPGGCGTVFELIRCSSAPSGYDFKVLHNFNGRDGGGPSRSLVRDAAGDLYGTASDGGTGSFGTVFKLSPTGALTVLHNFTGGADGQYPAAGLVRDGAGNLYGTTPGGGTSGYGVVFKLSPAGTETVLYSFTGGADGWGPGAGLLRDAAGNLYGTTVYGGGGNSNVCSTGGCGVVFKVSPTGTKTALYSFTGGVDGGNPQAGLIQDVVGNLYGTVPIGGATSTCDPPRGCGVVFRLTP